MEITVKCNKTLICTILRCVQGIIINLKKYNDEPKMKKKNCKKMPVGNINILPTGSQNIINNDIINLVWL